MKTPSWLFWRERWCCSSWWPLDMTQPLESCTFQLGPEKGRQAKYLMQRAQIHKQVLLSLQAVPKLAQFYWVQAQFGPPRVSGSNYSCSNMRTSLLKCKLEKICAGQLSVIFYRNNSRHPQPSVFANSPSAKLLQFFNYYYYLFVIKHTQIQNKKRYKSHNTDDRNTNLPVWTLCGIFLSPLGGCLTFSVRFEGSRRFWENTEIRKFPEKSHACSKGSKYWYKTSAMDCRVLCRTIMGQKKLWKFCWSSWSN